MDVLVRHWNPDFEEGPYSHSGFLVMQPDGVDGPGPLGLWPTREAAEVGLRKRLGL